MFAIREGSIITLAGDFPKAVMLHDGWQVSFHALPGITIRVALALAPTIDDAQRIAATAVRRERSMPTDAATIQRFHN